MFSMWTTVKLMRNIMYVDEPADNGDDDDDVNIVSKYTRKNVINTTK